MRLTLRQSIIWLVSITLFRCAPLTWADPSVIVRVRDISRAEAKGSTVEVEVGEPKAKELAHKGKQIPIEMRLPTPHPKNLFICEVYQRRDSAIINFKFPDKASAADFAGQLYAAKAKIANECNCH
jgi:hypothetical protein